MGIAVKPYIDKSHRQRCHLICSCIFLRLNYKLKNLAALSAARILLSHKNKEDVTEVVLKASNALDTGIGGMGLWTESH